MQEVAEITAALIVAAEPAYICPVCHEPVWPGEPDHEHLEDYLNGLATCNG